VLALDNLPASKPVYPTPIIISEIQTGAGTASDEFVELFNTSDQPVDITGWQVRYINATTAGDTTLLATVEGPTADHVYVPANGYYVLHTASVALPQTIAGQVYAAKLSSSDKAVGVFRANQETCLLEVEDAVGWGNSTLGEGAASINPAGSGDRLVRRYVNADGFYVDTDNNQHDVLTSVIVKDTAVPGVAVGASLGSANLNAISTDVLTPAQGLPSGMSAIDLTGCELSPDDTGGTLEPPTDQPPATVEPGQEDTPDEDTGGPIMPAGDIGLKAPQLTELLPNPGKPLMDNTDEFIEIYNSNDAVFDLSGFIIESGLTSKKRYVIPRGITIAAKSFRAFFSADTHIALSNTAGQVSLLDPFGNVLSTSLAYASAKDNQSWAYANGTWQWSASPTPGTANAIKTPAPKKKSSSSTASSKSSTSKGSAAVKGLSATATTNAQTDFTEEQRTPIHTGVLALVGIFAILYGAYEYRSDLANKIFQLRSYRAARREARQSVKGR